MADPVWDLYAEVIASAGPLPTLVEWDNDLPAWPVLAAEAARSDAHLDAQAVLAELRALRAEVRALRDQRQA